MVSSNPKFDPFEVFKCIILDYFHVGVDANLEDFQGFKSNNCGAVRGGGI